MKFKMPLTAFQEISLTLMRIADSQERRDKQIDKIVKTLRYYTRCK